MLQEPMLRLVGWCLATALGLGLQACAITHVLRVADAQRIPVSQLVAELQPTPLVFLGENHDDASHHAFQLDVIAGLHASGVPLAIGLEMFQLDSQPALDAWVAGRLSEAHFVRLYKSNWRYLSWGLYSDIFLFARDHHLPLLALNVPQAIIQQVARQGWATLSQAQRRMLPAGVTDPITPANQALMAGMHPAHGARATTLTFMAQAQVLRNRVMAQALLRQRRAQPQTHLVVLTGGVHASRQGGVPSELATASCQVVLPPMPEFDPDHAGDTAADYLLD